MRKLNLFLLASILILMVTGCQTIKDKTDAIVEKENEKLSKYIIGIIYCSNQQFILWLKKRTKLTQV